MYFNNDDQKLDNLNATKNKPKIPEDEKNEQNKKSISSEEVSTKATEMKILFPN